MLPNNPETWIFLSISCLIGFLIGQWLKSRRKKDKTADDYIEGLKQHALAETRLQAQKSQKAKKKKPRPSGPA
jgi:hypothetical protein